MSENTNSNWLVDFFKNQTGPGKRFENNAAMAKFLGLPITQATKLFNFLKGADTQYKAVLDWFGKLGGRLEEPDADTARDVCFVDAKIVPAGSMLKPPEVMDYLAVPVVEEVGAGPGIIPMGELRSWFLVYKNQDAVRYRRNLIAVEIGKKSESMLPTLKPRDIVLVDRDDRDVRMPGHIMLVMDEDGAGMIKRVSVQEDEKNKDFRIVYYSDNAVENPPMIYSLRSDFLNDWDRAIVGRVVWAWSDVREK